MNKQEFKRDYSAYRKLCSSAYYKGLEAYKSAVSSSPVYRQALMHEVLPVGLKSYNHIKRLDSFRL